MTTDNQTKIWVWSLPIRLGHWVIVISVGVAWITHHGPAWLHHTAGYVALALAGLRTFTGMLGPARDRFSRFVASPENTFS